MKFPITVKHRKAEAKIYGKSKGYPFYRVCAYVAGKRQMSHFRIYSEANVMPPAEAANVIALSTAATR